MYKAEIKVTLLPSILDPKGKASLHALHNLGYEDIKQTRIGKFIELELNASSEKEARELAEKACEKLLANPVMEDYSITILNQA